MNTKILEFKFHWWAAIIDAGYGWQALFARQDGTPCYIEIKKWGMSIPDINTMAITLTPLDDLFADLSKKPGFIQVLDPSSPNPTSEDDINRLCDAKVIELRWNKQ